MVMDDVIQPHEKNVSLVFIYLIVRIHVLQISPEGSTIYSVIILFHSACDFRTVWTSS